MKDLFRGKILTVIIVIATLVLAGVAVFTAIRLNQTRQESITPTRPASSPAAQSLPAGECEACGGEIVCDGALSCVQGLCVPQESVSDPQGFCSTGEGVDPNQCAALAFSISASSPTPTQTAEPTSTPTLTTSPIPTTAPTSAPTATPTSSPPALPDAGTSWPTLMGIGIGILIILTSVLIAL